MYTPGLCRGLAAGGSSDGKVYQNSLCNIAATGASNSDQGCFTNREPSLVSPCTVESAWANTPRQTYYVVGSRFWALLGAAPLNRRAWAVQERLLAPRVLHYGRDQLFWEYHELDACETFPRGLPFYLGGTCFKCLDPQIDGERRRRVGNEEPDPTLDVYHLWDKIVKTYTWGSLTKLEDKLIALSGLAKRVQEMLGVEYLAGLWKRILPSQLLWGVYGNRQGNGLPSVRPATYRAPSWSWASLDGCVSWPSVSRKGFMVTIIEAHVTPITNDTMGEVSDAFIRLLNEFATVKASVSADIDADDIGGIFYCLPLQTSTGPIYSWIYGLVLRSTGSRKGTYQRFGTFSLKGSEARHAFAAQENENLLQDDLYEDAEQRTLTLI